VSWSETEHYSIKFVGLPTDKQTNTQLVVISLYIRLCYIIIMINSIKRENKNTVIV